MQIMFLTASLSSTPRHPPPTPNTHKHTPLQACWRCWRMLTCPWRSRQWPPRAPPPASASSSCPWTPPRPSCRQGREREREGERQRQRQRPPEARSPPLGSPAACAVRVEGGRRLWRAASLHGRGRPLTPTHPPSPPRPTHTHTRAHAHTWTPSHSPHPSTHLPLPAAGGGQGRLWQAAGQGAGGRPLGALPRRPGRLRRHLCGALPLVRAALKSISLSSS